MTREGQLDCVKLLASRGAGLDAKTEVKKLETIIILREIIFVLMLRGALKFNLSKNLVFCPN